MRVSVKYEVVTPLMLGGANHSPEFRLPSYVHMLRWWWRFLALGRFGSEGASYWEAVLFGWHAKPFGRKRVSFRLVHLNDNGCPAPWEKDLQLDRWSGINYLTAQGFREREQAKVTDFRVEARLGKRCPADVPELAGDADNNWDLAKETLVDAMALVGLLGGLGARSRRGFGSLAISRLEVQKGDQTKTVIEQLPENVDSYSTMISNHLGMNRHSGLPPYSALSDKYTCEICASGSDARELMNDIGWAFQIYRSYGQRDGNGEHVHNKNSGGSRHTLDAGERKTWYKQDFLDDHDEFYSDSRNLNHFDNRAVFGLPHNYGNVQVGWDSDQLARSENGPMHRRRASPLLFHFHRLADGSTIFAASSIPAKFTPDGACLRANGNLRTQNINSAIEFELAWGFAAFLRDPDATGDKKGVQYTSFNVENITVAS